MHSEGDPLRIYTEADLGELARLVNSEENALAKSALCQGGAEVEKDSQVHVMLENSLDLGEAYANGGVDADWWSEWIFCCF
ncbi:MAG: hypothetical protein LBP35_01525 [Candidatus Ancillula trichonymphae]|nr:hypothetical protein [Candidatus Ancillula trichonymphae]